MATTIVNVSKRRRLISLDHPAFYRKRWGFRRQLVRTYEHNPRTGAKGVREIRKPIAGVITLLAGEKRVDLPDEIAAVPAVKRLKAQGDILVRLTTDEELAELEKAKAATAKPKKTTAAAPKPAASTPKESPPTATGEKNGKRSK